MCSFSEPSLHAKAPITIKVMRINNVSRKWGQVCQLRKHQHQTNVSFSLQLTKFRKMVFFSVDWYKHVFVNRLWVSALLSLECAVANLILFATLLRLEDFRTWLLYPVFLQAFVDFIGPGIANCLSEFWSYQYVTEVMGRRQVMPVFVWESLFRLETFSQCILQGSFV